MEASNNAYYDLLAQCVAPYLTPTAKTRIQELALRTTDWNALIKLADTCRATPLLYDRLHACGISVTPDVALKRMHRTAVLNAHRNTHLTLALAKVMDRLKAVGIPALTYKGPVLAHEAYDNPSLRVFDDLDILVNGRDLKKAKETITALGYKEILAGKHSACLPASPYILRHKDGTHTIDIADRLTNNHLAFEIPNASLWQNSRSVEIDGHRVQTMSIEHHLLYLCVHGAKHLWHRPTWIADVAGLLQTSNCEINWKQLIQTAKSTDSLRMLIIAIKLARREYDTPIPPEMTAALRDDPHADKLCDSIYSIIRRTPGVLSCGKYETLKLYLQMQPKFRARLRNLTILLFAPTEKDYKFINLPQPLHPLYYAVRPLRLTTRLVTHK